MMVRTALVQNIVHDCSWTIPNSQARLADTIFFLCHHLIYFTCFLVSIFFLPEISMYSPNFLVFILLDFRRLCIKLFGLSIRAFSISSLKSSRDLFLAWIRFPIIPNFTVNCRGAAIYVTYVDGELN